MYVTSVVQVETLWVLKCAYGFGKSDLLRVLEHWLVNRAFMLENAEEFALAVEMFREQRIAFFRELLPPVTELEAVLSQNFCHPYHWAGFGLVGE